MNEKTESKLRRWEPYIYLALIVIAAASIAVLVAELVHQQHQTRHLAAQIQRQRTDGIIRSCRDQNQRHDTATAYLNQLLKKSGVSAARRRQSQVQVGGFINALAPKQNCLKLAQRTVHPTPAQTAHQKSD
jgi:hypothetical protein